MGPEVLTGAVFVTTAVVGATELIKRLNKKDFEAAQTIVASALIGVGSGALGVLGLDPVTGLYLGLGASGLVKVAQSVRG